MLSLEDAKSRFYRGLSSSNLDQTCTSIIFIGTQVKIHNAGYFFFFIAKLIDNYCTKIENKKSQIWVFWCGLQSHFELCTLFSALPTLKSRILLSTHNELKCGKFPFWQYNALFASKTKTNIFSKKNWVEDSRRRPGVKKIFKKHWF